MLEQDLAHLPDDVREQLAILELELSEGDITQKGYEKKRNLILAKFNKGCSAGPGQSKGSPGTRAHRQHQRRLTRDEARFHSEIRQEAVQQALAEYSQGYKERPSIVQPIKRLTESRPRQHSRASDSSSDDDDSLVGSLKRKNQSSGKVNAGLGGSRNGSQAPPDVTGGAAVEAMLRRVREQHEIKLQVSCSCLDDHRAGISCIHAHAVATYIPEAKRLLRPLTHRLDSRDNVTLRQSENAMEVEGEYVENDAGTEEENIGGRVHDFVAEDVIAEDHLKEIFHECEGAQAHLSEVTRALFKNKNYDLLDQVSQGVRKVLGELPVQSVRFARRKPMQTTGTGPKPSPIVPYKKFTIQRSTLKAEKKQKRK